MDTSGIKALLAAHPEYKAKLFARGFLLTDEIIDADEYPFYGMWNREQIGEYTILVSKEQHYYSKQSDQKTLLLVGHAYDPFMMISDERTILEFLLEAKGDAEFYERLSNLTGIFTLFSLNEDAVSIYGDASCLQTTFYTHLKEHVYISSHANLIGDLLSLSWDPYIKRLCLYRFFRLLGNSLPGDLTQFKEVKRLNPNTLACIAKDGTITSTRFFYPQKLKKTEREIVDEASRILNNNMRLIAKKWDTPAISVTGGVDSKTTLACTKGVYDKFQYFSYISSDAEEVDAVAAAKICGALGLNHKIYCIPDSDADMQGISEIREILNWNTGNIRYSNPNDVRKRAFFSDTTDFDVEVKSWASEICRAYYSKRFNGRTNFGDEPTPRKCTTLYKIFLHNRKLVQETDAVFKDWLQKYFQRASIDPIDWQEQFFWEFRNPSWNGLVITGEHRYSFDITVPYNNRRLLSLMLSVPIEDRISDKVYSDIRKKMNPAIDETGVFVTNLKHTNNRARLENIYYTLHSTVRF